MAGVLPLVLCALCCILATSVLGCLLYDNVFCFALFFALCWTLVWPGLFCMGWSVLHCLVNGIGLKVLYLAFRCCLCLVCPLYSGIVQDVVLCLAFCS